MWDEAVRMGIRNRQIIELARRHCLNMEFVPCGGRGLAEAETGLPIDMRQVRCPVALGGMSSNLPWIATEFYRGHCVECDLRRPTGKLPNLATEVEEADAEAVAAEVEEQARLARAQVEWEVREEGRRSLAAGAGEAMAGAIRDIAVLDSNPATPASPKEREAARARLAALADRVPKLFSPEVVTAAIELADKIGCAHELLDPLRRLARQREEFATDVVRAALVSLQRGHAIWAGPCVAELVGHVPVDAINDNVCASLIRLAGAPTLDRFGRSRPNHTNDPTGLQAIATIAPQVVARVLRSMLPSPSAPMALVLPHGTTQPRLDVSAFDRASAAGAVRALAATHSNLAADLVETLVLNLAVPPDDEYHDPALPAVERTLATLLVLDVGDVAGAIDTAGGRGNSEMRERLLKVLLRAADMITSEPRWPEPGDPAPDADRKAEVAAALLTSATARIAGDWGDQVRVQAADLISDLAAQDPEAMLRSLPALLGAVLHLVDTGREPPPSALDVVSAEPVAMRMLERMSRDSAVAGATRRVLDAVKAAAVVDPAAVCSALVDLIADERETERGSDLLWWLLRTLGKIGRQHGDEPRVLRTILPTLHSYLVGTDALLRSRAIDAWVEIASVHALPSTLVDLLPVLTADTTIAVAQAVARAATRLDWPEEARPRLLYQALLLLNGVDAATHSEAMKDGINSAAWLAREMGEQVRAAVEQKVLDAAAKLDGYDLRDALRRQWLPAIARSPQMARLRLRQAADPQINDRWNVHDEEELCALLACGPGLAALQTSDLAPAALALTPERPLAAAEFAEVAWRAGRPGDAASIMAAVRAATPDQPAYDAARLLIDVIHASADTDAAATAGGDWHTAATRATAAAAALTSDHDDDITRRLAASVIAAAEVRRLLAGKTAATDADPAQARRTHADALAQAGSALHAASQQATDTGAYARAIASACDVAAHLLRADAAVLDADTDSVAAHANAATRRADLIAQDLADRFDPTDPLAVSLLRHLRAVAGLSAGTSAAPVLATWSTLPIPVPIVTGPRVRTRPAGTAARIVPTDGADDAQERPVAVVLASLDGRLITGPEVLRPSRVYNLAVEVQVGPWPEWADRLDGELLTHLTAAEITMPEFTWGRADHAGDGETYTKSGPLVLRFALGPGQPAPPLLMRLTWRGQRDGRPVIETLDITGHRELRLRPYDPTRDRATDYPVFDERLLRLYDALTRVGYDADQLQAFCRLLTSICRVGLRMTWDKKYRRGSKVSERAFHDDLHQQLLADPELCGRVDRGSPLALGYLDVRHDGITAELKVERKTPVTRDSAPKYTTVLLNTWASPPNTPPLTAPVSPSSRSWI